MTRTVQISFYNHDSATAERVDPSLVTSTGNAEPTSRVLEGSGDHGYAQEWAEPAQLPDGRKCLRMYLFTEDEIADEPEDYPWDDEHVARIKLVA
jgi:hypothetical protein